MKQTNKVLTGLQSHKRPGWVKHDGMVLARRKRIAQPLCDHWPAVTQARGASFEQCPKYLTSLRLSATFAVMGRALYCPLSPAIRA